MSGSEEYVYDEATGEWRPTSELTAGETRQPIRHPPFRDNVGNGLADGDSVILIKDLKVKGTNQILRRGTVIKSIRLTDDPQEIGCPHESIKGLVLRAEFVKKR